MWINQQQRGTFETTLSQEEKSYLKDLESATDKKLPQGEKLYRSVDAEAVFGKMSDMDYENLVNAIVFKNNDKFSAAAKNKYVNNAMGKTITDKGFMSTSTSYNLTKDFNDFTGSSKPVVIEFTTGKNTKGINLQKSFPKLESRMGQKETLLKNNTSFKIKDISSRDGNIYIKADLS